jgi:hypothetical protein
MFILVLLLTGVNLSWRQPEELLEELSRRLQAAGQNK